MYYELCLIALSFTQIPGIGSGESTFNLAASLKKIHDLRIGMSKQKVDKVLGPWHSTSLTGSGRSVWYFDVNILIDFKGERVKRISIPKVEDRAIHGIGVFEIVTPSVIRKDVVQK